MCGLIAVAGRVPEADLAAAVRAAGARGPHSWGWAYPSAVVRGPGRLPVPSAEERGTALALGHSRLATSTAGPGTVPDPEEGQPVRASRWTVAHNGTSGALALVGRAEAVPWDTRGILAVLEAEGLEGLENLALFDGKPQALLCSRGEELVALRVHGATVSAHPLYLTRYPAGLIVSSSPVGEAELLDAGAPRHLTY